LIRILLKPFLNRWAVVVSSTVALALLSLKFLPVPFAWIGISLAVVAFGCAPHVTRAFCVPMLVAASASFAFGLAEFMMPPVIRATLEQQPTLEQKDPLLGWTLVPSQVTRSVARVGDEVIYDVTYTTDASGRRVSPAVDHTRVRGCVLFFADSFVFGFGVQDTQTLPYQVGMKAEGQFRVVNLAVSAYGAEHMLAAIERGSLAAHPPCEPTHVVYVALPPHVQRAAGKSSFSTRGPRYQLGLSGALNYVGTAPDSSLPGWRGWSFGLGHQAAKSRLLFGLLDREPTPTEADLSLYFAIVDRAFRLFRQRWPDAALHIISWDIHPHLANGRDRFHAGLQDAPAQLHPIDAILPAYSDDYIKYALHPADLHPNAMAYEIVAAYVVARILRVSHAGEPSATGAR
jgi:hypothetical protein